MRHAFCDGPLLFRRNVQQHSMNFPLVSQNFLGNLMAEKRTAQNALLTVLFTHTYCSHQNNNHHFSVSWRTSERCPLNMMALSSTNVRFHKQRAFATSLQLSNILFCFLFTTLGSTERKLFCCQLWKPQSQAAIACVGYCSPGAWSSSLVGGADFSVSWKQTFCINRIPFWHKRNQFWYTQCFYYTILSEAESIVTQPESSFNFFAVIQTKYWFVLAKAQYNRIFRQAGVKRQNRRILSIRTVLFWVWSSNCK